MDVAVVGAGIIGLSIAAAAQAAGFSVRLFDPQPANGATFAAAGMLATASEFSTTEPFLLDALRESAELWQHFEPRVASFESAPTLALAVDANDARVLAEHAQRLAERGLSARELALAEVRDREPSLGPRLSSALLVEGERRVDPRELAAALQSTIAVERQLVTAISAGSVTLADGTRVAAREIVVATGAAPVEGLTVRAVRGDIVRLRGALALTATVRATVHGNRVYVVPRRDGSFVVGASEREHQPVGPRAGNVVQLLRDAQVILPGLADLEILEVTTRARPAAPDNAPLLGRLDSGVIIATGFYRHGVALAPLAATVVVELLAGGDSARWAHFSPARFASTVVAS